MGQHKYNPTAIKAKNGELPPKPKPMGKREWERLIHTKVQEAMYGGLVRAICREMREGENDYDANK